MFATFSTGQHATDVQPKDLANPQASAVAKFPSLGELFDSLLLHFSLVKFARLRCAQVVRHIYGVLGASTHLIFVKWDQARDGNDTYLKHLGTANQISVEIKTRPM